MKNIAKNQSGYIALIAVLIVVTVSLAIGLSLNILSIGETQAGLVIQQSEQSFGLADSCMQEAYLQLRRNGSYNSGSLYTDQGSCKITVTSQLLSRTIAVESNVNNVIRKLESDVQLGVPGSEISVTSWLELN